MAIVLQLGRVVATAGVLGKLTRMQLVEPLHRHCTGDWGEIDDEDRATNDRAVRDGDRVLSAYTVAGHRIWIITEADRSVTTVLFPDEY